MTWNVRILTVLYVVFNILFYSSPFSGIGRNDKNDRVCKKTLKNVCYHVIS